MTTMLEKVARAISRTAGGSADDEAEWEVWLPEARAALQAIREPDEAMMAPFAYLEAWQMPHTKARFTAMIDAILNGADAPSERADQEPRARLERLLSERQVEEYEETLLPGDDRLLTVRFGPKSAILNEPNSTP